jgi:hypothetical protein
VAANDRVEPRSGTSFCGSAWAPSRVRFAPLAADAPLTRPARSRRKGNYRSEGLSALISSLSALTSLCRRWDTGS